MDELIRPPALARRHALALRLDALGAPDDLIADCLGIETEAVGPLLAVARAKLAQAGAAPANTSPDHQENPTREDNPS